MKTELKNKLLLVCLLLVLLSCKTVGKNPETEADLLQLNPAIETGVLNNGVSYFIKENKKPENRVELRLVIKTGSLQEDDDQRGLAHFVEHMAFNGTKNFEKDRLIKYLESLGMGFGPEINAYTSFNETVYQLSIPADDPEIMDNAFLILEDWAHGITFDDQEIEKERGVIVEEWRGGRGVQGRYRDKLIPVLLQGSRYSERLPIGDVEIIKNASSQRIRDYYNTWYRPELMSVVVVGTIDSESVKEKITKHFSFKNSNKKGSKVDSSVPVKPGTAIEIIADKEMTYNGISYFIKREGIVLNSKNSYREYINDLLAILMFNSRMEEIYTKPGSPFIYAGGGFSDFVKEIDITTFNLQVEDGKTVSGFEALLDEIEKVKQGGFTEAELTRAKDLVNMIMTNQYNERENYKNSSVVNEIVAYITEGSVTVGIEKEVELIAEILPTLNLEAVNKRAVELYTGTDRVLTVQIPEKSGVVPPLKEDFTRIFNSVSTKKFDKRVEEKITRELFDIEVTKGNTVKRDYNKELNITTLELSNGVKVILKPTDFKADEIIINATSPGGLSLVNDDEYISGLLATSLAQSSGINGFDAVELGRLITGKNVGISPWVGMDTEGVTGSSSVKDFELLLQLLHLYFVKPEFSQESYNVLINNIENYIKNRENSPEVLFNDRYRELLGSSSYRYRPIKLETLKDADFEECVRVYNERFKYIDDFTFVITGSFTEESVTPLLEKYLGSVKGNSIGEKALDLGIKPPKGIVEDTIIKGLEDKSRVKLVFTGDYNGDFADDLTLYLLANYLEEELRVLIRENLSGTYGVSVFSSVKREPAKEFELGFTFGCEPGREDELTEAALELLATVKNGSFNEDGILAVKNNYLRNMELNLKSNNYWNSAIIECIENNREFTSITDLDLTKIDLDRFKKVAKNYITPDNYIRVTLKPE